MYYLLHEEEGDIVNYFTSRLIHFHEPKVNANTAYHSHEYNKSFILC